MTMISNSRVLDLLLLVARPVIVAILSDIILSYSKCDGCERCCAVQHSPDSNKYFVGKCESHEFSIERMRFTGVHEQD